MVDNYLIIRCNFTMQIFNVFLSFINTWDTKYRFLACSALRSHCKSFVFTAIFMTPVSSFKMQGTSFFKLNTIWWEAKSKKFQCNGHFFSVHWCIKLIHVPKGELNLNSNHFSALCKHHGLQCCATHHQFLLNIQIRIWLQGGVWAKQT